MELTQDMIIAASVAAIAEETGTEADKLRVLSFSEIQKSSLDKFIEEHGIIYKKYQLGDCPQWESTELFLTGKPTKSKLSRL
jgi:hypothetical protein